MKPNKFPKPTEEETKPKQTRMILVTLKRPVKLPTTLINAIREGDIEKISAFEEDADEADHCPYCGAVLRDPPNCCEPMKVEYRREWNRELLEGSHEEEQQP